MQELEVIKLLSLLEAEYPLSFRNLTTESRALKIELWTKEFSEDNPKFVFAATRLLMRDGREFAPTSGQIREKMQSLLEVETKNPQEAWALVSKACSNGYYGYKEEFEKLPEDIRRVIGRPEQLKEWAVMDSDVVQSVVASNFMRNYSASVKREKELARIPESIKTLISGISGKTKEIEGEVINETV